MCSASRKPHGQLPACGAVNSSSSCMGLLVAKLQRIPSLVVEEKGECKKLGNKRNCCLGLRL